MIYGCFIHCNFVLWQHSIFCVCAQSYYWGQIMRLLRIRGKLLNWNGNEVNYYYLGLIDLVSNWEMFKLIPRSWYVWISCSLFGLLFKSLRKSLTFSLISLWSSQIPAELPTLPFTLDHSADPLAYFSSSVAYGKLYRVLTHFIWPSQGINIALLQQSVK